MPFVNTITKSRQPQMSPSTFQPTSSMLPLAKVCCGNWASRVKLSRCWHTWLCFKLWNTSSPLNLRCVSCGCPQALRNISCNQPLQIYVPVLMMVIMTEEVTTGLMQSPVANICLNSGPLPAQVPPLCRLVLVNLSKEQFILHPAPVTWCCLASLSFLDQSALLMVLF